MWRPEQSPNCCQLMLRMQPLESVTEFDVPVPIPLTPPCLLLLSRPTPRYLPLKAAEVFFLKICVCKNFHAVFIASAFASSFCACLSELSVLL